MLGEPTIRPAPPEGSADDTATEVTASVWPGALQSTPEDGRRVSVLPGSMHPEGHLVPQPRDDAHPALGVANDSRAPSSTPKGSLGWTGPKARRCRPKRDTCTWWVTQPTKA